jgi:hypothetical protein
MHLTLKIGLTMKSKMSSYVLTIVDCHLRDMLTELISIITNVILNYMNVKTVVIVTYLTYVEKMHIKLQIKKL